MTDNSIWSFGNNIFQDGLLSFVIEALFTFLIAWVILKLINRFFNHVISTSKNRSIEIPLHYLQGILRVVVLVIAVFSILSGIKAMKGIGTALLGATSVISVILGLAAQESFGNFISGFFLSLNQPFKIGDMIVLPEKNIQGRVEEITFRHTVLDTFNNTKVIIPNSVMNSAIINNIESDRKGYTNKIVFTVGYDTDIPLMKKVIYDVVKSVNGIKDTRSKKEKAANKEPFLIRITDYQASGIAIAFSITYVDYASSFAIESEIRAKLLTAFKENHIEIPYDKIQVLH